MFRPLLIALGTRAKNVNTRRFIWLSVLLFTCPVISYASGGNAALASHRWIHGSEDCVTNQDPPIETYKYDEDTYVLRQNKCLSYEAPFIYVMFGSHTVFVQDTGATEDAGKFPLYETVRTLVEARQPEHSQPLKLLVIHSHSHGDHKAADAQFKGVPNVTLIEPNEKGLKGFLASLESAGGVIDLGGRELSVLPIPGHQAESIAIYDPHTKWLLTGDTIYPGIISVLDWDEYRASIETLVNFASSHKVSAVLGSHIEMSKTPSVVYERGTIYQPEEASLVLPVEVLSKVSTGLAKTEGKRQTVMTDSVVVESISFPVRVLIRFLKMVGVG